MKSPAMLLLCAAALTAAVADEPVRIDSGLVSGVPRTTPQDVRSFRGIPFAAPPVGSLRWRPPHAPAHWSGVRKSDQFSDICPQAVRTGTAALLPTSKRLGQPNEDCLYLNVWTAAKSDEERLPVMVYIHGGGYTAGSASALVFDGDALARKGVVVVTTNYRLGILGFFAHPELTKESEHNASGNYGLLDQVAALEWVQRNITAFGGDPKRVMVFGQSAGSGSVLALMSSPLAKGLFKRATGESGGPGMGPMRKRENAEQAGAKLGSLAELRARPASEIVRQAASGVIVDGWFLPEDESAIFRAGKQNDVSLLIGSNGAEANVLGRPVPATQYVEQTKARYGDLADSYLKIYPAGSEDQARQSQMNALNDSFAWQMRTWARWQVKSGRSNTYLYYFTREPPPDAPIKGPAHDAELYYVFHNLRLYDQQWADWDRKLEDIMSSYWTNFAASGDPNGAGVPRWPPYSEVDADKVMSFGNSVAMGQTRLDNAKSGLLEAVYVKQMSR